MFFYTILPNKSIKLTENDKIEYKSNGQCEENDLFDIGPKCRKNQDRKCQFGKKKKKKHFLKIISHMYEHERVINILKSSWIPKCKDNLVCM